jgi:hypothetical protein
MLQCEVPQVSDDKSSANLCTGFVMVIVLQMSTLSIPQKSEWQVRELQKKHPHMHVRAHNSINRYEF